MEHEFAPGSAGGTVAVIGFIACVLFGWLTWRGRKTPAKDTTKFFGTLAFVGLLIFIWPFWDARSVFIDGNRVTLRYLWPRPDRALDARQISHVERITRNSRRHHDAYLVITMRNRRDSYESMASGSRWDIDQAKEAIEQAMHGDEEAKQDHPDDP